MTAAELLPHWLSTDGPEVADGNSVLRSQFHISSPIKSAELRGVADFCRARILINGEMISEVESYGPVFHLDVARHLKPGDNTIHLIATDEAGPSAVFAQLKITHAGGKETVINSDSRWTVLHNVSPTRGHTDFGDRGWKAARDVGPINPDYWDLAGHGIQVGVYDDYEQWQDAKTAKAGTPPSQFQLPAGFEIELLRSALPEEDSWIAMAIDAKGRIIIAREKKGLLRMTLPTKRNGAMGAEVVNEDVAEIRGIVVSGDSVYVNSNNHNLRQEPRDRRGGLVRLRDTNGDDQFDEVSVLGERTETGGHGRNDLVLGPDGKLYMIGGDSVSVPKNAVDLAPSVAPILPGDDFPNGHVIRTDREGKVWALVCKGLRNPFGIDFNEHGEMFTYDADAEFDMGSPWYRPTHVRHLVTGADYGWRRVTNRWPPYYPDHADEPPVTLNVGKGSPTSVKFGTRSKFPERYRKALFVMDWTYGRIFVVHMAPLGASYACKPEVFLRGRPANVTDLEFGPDGALYFVTGGRGTQSGLYRVRYTGDTGMVQNIDPKQPGRPLTPSLSPDGGEGARREGEAPSRRTTPHEKARSAHAEKARKIRRELEAIGKDALSADVERIVRHLGDRDPWLRYAARTALEKLPLKEQAQIGKQNLNDSARISFLTALVRSESGFDARQIVSRSIAIRWSGLTASDRLALLRVIEIVLMRNESDLAAPLQFALRSYLNPAYPVGDVVIDRELARLLVALNEPTAVLKTMTLLDVAADQHDRFHYLHVLREARTGWSDDLRRRYFSALRQTDEFRGGAGLTKFLKQVRDDALASIADGKQREQYAALFKKPEAPKVDFAKLMASRPFVKEWKMNDLAVAVATSAGQRNLANGKKLFGAAACILCHQLGGEGRVFGPDLTAVAGRFSRRDILESILDPSKAVDEKYLNVTVETLDGESHTGQIVMQGDYRKPVLRLATNPFEPENLLEIPKVQIREHRVSNISAMPSGLLNSLSKDDILDLLAYIESGGR